MRNDLKTTTDLVKEILEEKPETRSSDNLLYIEVTKRCGEEVGCNICGFPFADVLRYMSKWGLPSMETVGRCRRKAQLLYPELAATSEVSEFRADRQEEFREYGRR
ncbi:hypothetical protein ACPW7J_02090 [Ihubacter sp. rT4E-8]|uniref:hypothetical protein n=1 Tax=Ihubacter sp. rT4E-8 TaxID=3242369 RepID=UPI003CE9C680